MTGLTQLMLRTLLQTSMLRILTWHQGPYEVGHADVAAGRGEISLPTNFRTGVNQPPLSYLFYYYFIIHFSTYQHMVNMVYAHVLCHIYQKAMLKNAVVIEELTKEYICA